MPKYNLKRQEHDERDYLFLNKLTVPERKVDLPRRVDLRSKFPDVFNQLELGSCSANAGCSYLAMLLKLDVVLSRLYMYYKEREREKTISEDSGATIRDICMVALQGVCEEKYFPYKIKDFAKAPTKDALANAKLHRAKSAHAVRTFQEIKQALALQGSPVLCGIVIYESFESEEVAQSGRIPLPNPDEKEMGGHAVLVVGYDDDMQCLIVRNSWGKEWGDKGYFYLPYQFVQYNLAFDFWVLG